MYNTYMVIAINCLVSPWTESDTKRGRHTKTQLREMLKLLSLQTNLIWMSLVPPQRDNKWVFKLFLMIGNILIYYTLYLCYKIVISLSLLIM